jgi:hypothetical protein
VTAPRLTLVDRLLGLPRAAWSLILLAGLVTLVGINRMALVSTQDLRANSTIVQDAEVLFVPDTRLSRMITLGYDQAAADLLWLRTLGYFARHFSASRQYAWLEHFIKQIIELDPNFRKVYYWAGASVLYGRRFTNENVMLSNIFYEKAMARFPDDYEAAYRLGLNYYVELKSDDPDEKQRFREKGLSYLERAANAPNVPPDVINLTASVSKRLGKSQLARQYLVDLYIGTQDPIQRAGLKARIDALKTEAADGAAVAAVRFRDAWQATFPYIPPPLYGLLGEPTTRNLPDRPWRDLLPDVDLSDVE